MQAEDKYNQKYNPKSNRLQNYDYSINGWYFITICSKDREYYFGEVVDWEMILNDLGKIVYDEILDLPKHFDYLEWDEFIVMPNHLHLILFLNNKPVETSIYPVETQIYRVSEDKDNKKRGEIKWDTMKWDTINGCLYEKWWTDVKTPIYRVSDYEKWWTLMKEKNIMLNKNKIWFIIRKLKWKSTFLINKFCKDIIYSVSDKIFFAWQSNYYDRIIRNEDELQRIRKYIIENPLKWEYDKNNTENIFM